MHLHHPHPLPLIPHQQSSHSHYNHKHCNQNTTSHIYTLPHLQKSHPVYAQPHRRQETSPSHTRSHTPLSWDSPPPVPPRWVMPSTPPQQRTSFYQRAFARCTIMEISV
ncbi:unnamed protein product [Knipowitschia caucasica]|uniref:Uncharacterized protein n=1 Tax=Knipowitschia caucasica TaxID=637954 RepID=A0AAV2JIN1_KNICA